MDLLEVETRNYLTTASIGLVTFYLPGFYLKSYPFTFFRPVVGNVLSEFFNRDFDRIY
jgi:hypothetical protein